MSLKAENLQRTGAFKIRGAYNTVAQLSERERAAGVVTASAGNHGQAVAWAAREGGIPATIVVPRARRWRRSRPLERTARASSWRARTTTSRSRRRARVERETGATFVHAFEDPRVIAGQGTLGLELADQLPEGPGTVVVPVGGGGLVSGIAIALAALRPELRVVGVQAADCAPLAGHAPTGATIADGIAVKQPGTLTGAIVRELWTSSSSSTTRRSHRRSCSARAREARRRGSRRGAVAALVAAGSRERPRLRAPRGRQRRRDDAQLVIRHGLTASGRHLVVSLLIPDRPGQLARIVGLSASERANILAIATTGRGGRSGCSRPRPS